MVLALMMGGRGVVAASTLPVSPGGYPTIQAAIDAASNGDEITVPPGTYYEQIDFLGKAITVRSTDGPASTILDGDGGCNSIVRFADDEDRDSILDGFSIRNLDSVEGGAAIEIEGASPTIRNCVIEQNWSDEVGGIRVGCGSDPLIERCQIRDNEGGWVGGILVSNSYAEIRQCEITGNSADGPGGVAIDEASAELSDCLIAYNSSDSESYEDAGGVSIGSYGSTLLTNCTIVNNYSSGGLFGGVALIYGSSRVSNSIVWGNSPAGIGEIDYSRVVGNRVDFSDLQEPWDGEGAGNISINPQFRGVEDDFRLGMSSPCIDSGKNALVPEGAQTDLDGHPRFLDDLLVSDCAQSPGNCGDAPIVDMGAYERCGTSHLAFVSTPCHARAGETLLPQVAVINECGEIDTEAYGTVELTLSANPTDATLDGNRFVALYEGLASWCYEDELNITVAGCGYRFLATYTPGEGQPALPDGDTAESDPFRIKPGCMDHLSFCPQPDNTEAGAPIMTEVSVRDVYENVVRVDDLVVVLSLGQNPTGATLGGQFFGLTWKGVATWSYGENLNITRAGSGYTLFAEVFEGPGVKRGGLSGESEPFDVFGAYPQALVFTQQPHDTTAGAAIAARVELRDPYGNLAAGYALPIELLIDSNPSSATLGGATELVSSDGVATWGTAEALNITVADAGYTLRARVPSHGGTAMRSGPSTFGEAVSATFRILHGPATQLVFATQPSDALVNAAIGPPILVAILDAFGNAATDATNAITLSIGTNPASATLAGGGPVAATNGMAAFAAVSIGAAADGYTLLAESAGLQSAGSVGFNVIANAPAGNPNPGPPPIDLIGDGNAQNVLLSVLYRNALCGLGAAGMVPATLLGLVGLKRRHRR